MAIRSAAKLAADQAKLLASYRANQQTSPAGAGPPEASQPTLQYGKVTAVISTDPTHGPHLTVQAQTSTGTPPTFSATAAPPFRCYPAPGKTVGNYTANDYIRLTAAEQAMFAEPIA